MIWLSLIGVVEAVVYQARYRSAVVGGPWQAAWWTLATQALRVVWLAIGVGELMRGSDLVYVIAAYGFPAAIAVGVMRVMEHRREHRPALWATDNPNPAPAGSPPISQVRPMATFTMLNTFLSDQERADAAMKLDDRLAAWKAEAEVAREYNKLRNVKRGTGVLSDWQKRLSKARAATDAVVKENAHE